ncbi:MAG: uracil-DNA glycosylase family protein [Opitutales bacterium]
MREPADLLEAAADLRQAVDELVFDAPVTHVYNPLAYAWEGHAAYLERFGRGRKRVIFLGMNPGPFGMAQTGVPFGAIPAVRDWMGIEVPIGRPTKEHPKRPVTGFACPRVEKSGQRLWLELVAARFGTPEAFFADQLVLNYCPLIFMVESGGNYPPDKFSRAVREPLEALCNEHLAQALRLLQPEWAVGVGKYAEDRLRAAVEAAGVPVRVTRIIHPSPASPLANREWPVNPRHALEAAGIW